MLTKQFKMYDYDFEAKTFNNENIYGSKAPPLYPMSEIRDFPILLVCGKTDKLC